MWNVSEKGQRAIVKDRRSAAEAARLFVHRSLSHACIGLWRVCAREMMCAFNCLCLHLCVCCVSVGAAVISSSRVTAGVCVCVCLGVKNSHRRRAGLPSHQRADQPSCASPAFFFFPLITAHWSHVRSINICYAWHFPSSVNISSHRRWFHRGHIHQGKDYLSKQQVTLGE